MLAIRLYGNELFCGLQGPGMPIMVIRVDGTRARAVGPRVVDIKASIYILVMSISALNIDDDDSLEIPEVCLTLSALVLIEE